MILARRQSRHTHGKTGRLALIAFVHALAIPLVAKAGDAASIADKTRAAKTACLSGDFAKGVALLAELYVESNDLTFLFNQGRCYEQNGKYDEAIIRFREYQLKHTEAGQPPDALTERHIANCQALLDKQRPPAEPHPSSVAPPPAPPTPPQPLVASATEPSTASATPSIEVARSVPSPAPSGAGLRIAGAAAAIAGLAGLATGVVLNLKANSLANELEASSRSYDRDKASSRSTYETLGWIGYGAGGALLVGGVVLYYYGHVQGKRASTSSVALLPVLKSDVVGATLEGAF